MTPPIDVPPRHSLTRILCVYPRTLSVRARYVYRSPPCLATPPLFSRTVSGAPCTVVNDPGAPVFPFRDTTTLRTSRRGANLEIRSLFIYTHIRDLNYSRCYYYQFTSYVVSKHDYHVLKHTPPNLTYINRSNT